MTSRRVREGKGEVWIINSSWLGAQGYSKHRVLGDDACWEACRTCAGVCRIVCDLAVRMLRCSTTLRQRTTV